MKFRIFLGDDIVDQDYLEKEQYQIMQITLHDPKSHIVKAIF